MARWVPFLGLVTLLLAAVLLVARRSTGLLRNEAAVDPTEVGEPTRATVDPASLSPRALLANVALTQALVAGVVLAGIALFGIPAAAVGVTPGPWQTGVPALLLGLGIGATLWLLSEAAGRLADAAGLAYDESLRALLAPDSAGGWLVLLALVLPAIAVAEELLFRAALIGVPAAGLGVSPWLMAVVSSVAFALGHGAQGRVGIAATGALGLLLAAAFVLTGSLLVVVVAHYVVNALEFGVHEGLAG